MKIVRYILSISAMGLGLVACGGGVNDVRSDPYVETLNKTDDSATIVFADRISMTSRERVEYDRTDDEYLMAIAVGQVSRGADKPKLVNDMDLARKAGAKGCEKHGFEPTIERLLRIDVPDEFKDTFDGSFAFLGSCVLIPQS